MGPKKLYLAAYNLALLVGWSAIMFEAVRALLIEGVSGVFGRAEPLLLVCQSAAVLEIVHIMLGLVRSPLMTTALQVFSRVTLVWVVTWPYEEVQRGQLTLFRYDDALQNRNDYELRNRDHKQKQNTSSRRRNVVDLMQVQRAW